jgi:hypothetical protein
VARASLMKSAFTLEVCDVLYSLKFRVLIVFSSRSSFRWYRSKWMFVTDYCVFTSTMTLLFLQMVTIRASLGLTCSRTCGRRWTLRHGGRHMLSCIFDGRSLTNRTGSISSWALGTHHTLCVHTYIRNMMKVADHDRAG